MLGFIFIFSRCFAHPGSSELPQPNQPPPGTYYITNGVTSPSGQRLAATYQKDKPVTVTLLEESAAQRVCLGTSSHIFLSVSLDFVVEHHSWRAIYNTLYQRVRSSNSIA